MIRNSQRVLIHGSLPGDGSFRARATQARVTQTVSGYFMEIFHPKNPSRPGSAVTYSR